MAFKKSIEMHLTNEYIFNFTLIVGRIWNFPLVEIIDQKNTKLGNYQGENR